MSGAIAEAFAQAKAEKRAAFIPFLMAGDPDIEHTPRLLEAVVAGGADIVEIGIPFSDPIADGPVNQRAAARALASRTTLDDVLRMVARHRDRLGVPIVLFTYFNPLFARGLDTFAELAAASGVDGVLCVDLPPEEAEEELLPALHGHGIDSVFLLEPPLHRDGIHEPLIAAHERLPCLFITIQTGFDNLRVGELAPGFPHLGTAILCALLSPAPVLWL